MILFRHFNQQRARRASCNVRYRALWLLLLTLTVLPAHAMAPQPHELVSDVINRVLSHLDDGVETAPTEAIDLAHFFEQELSPHLAFSTITRWVVGKETWAGLSTAERDETLNVIRSHVVRVYASLLARGSDVDIQVGDSSEIQQHSARVRAVLSTPDGRDFALEFRLLMREQQWKLFDLTVDGLSFARSLRAELNPVISSGGVPGLKRYLAGTTQAK